MVLTTSGIGDVVKSAQTRTNHVMTRRGNVRANVFPHPFGTPSFYIFSSRCGGFGDNTPLSA